MLNQSASATRGPPAGSTATAGCCPMLAHHPNFYTDRFAATLPPPPPTATHRNILGLQQPSSAQVLPPAPTSQAPMTNHQIVQQQQQPNGNSAPSLVGANLTTGNHNQMAPHQQASGLTSAAGTTNLTRDHYSTSTDPTHTLPLQHLLARSLPPPNCMALAAAALASASFHQHQQLQLQQAHQQQMQNNTPINHSQQQTTTTNNNSTTNTPTATAPTPQPLSTSQTTNTNNTSNTNQVPILNFNNYASAIPPFLNIPTPAPLAAHLNNLTSTSTSNQHQPSAQPQEPVPLQTQQPNQQQQPPPPSSTTTASAAAPPPAQTVPQLPNFYSFPQMEQALAILTNPQVAGNLFSHVFNIYLQGGLRPEPHHTHHHHHPPHHYHHHLHGSHHHHHHHHGPNGQNNGQDDTMLTMSESKPRGLTRAEIDSLTPYIQMNEKDSRSCVICLSKFELKSKIRPLPCSHAFHAKCVDKWLRANRTCPICRRDALKTYRSKIKRI